MTQNNISDIKSTIENDPKGLKLELVISGIP